jgi:hypothetical protein
MGLAFVSLALIGAAPAKHAIPDRNYGAWRFHEGAQEVTVQGVGTVRGQYEIAIEATSADGAIGWSITTDGDGLLVSTAYHAGTGIVAIRLRGIPAGKTPARAIVEELQGQLVSLDTEKKAGLIPRYRQQIAALEPDLARAIPLMRSEAKRLFRGIRPPKCKDCLM